MPRNELINAVMELIHNGQDAIEGQKVQDETVILIGLTRTGKTTLVNFVNGVPLESFRDGAGASYKLRVKVGSAELPGMKIGHSHGSCTRSPIIFSPPKKSLSIIDMPGFGDTGDLGKNLTSRIAQDIANAYFRKAITDKAKNFKIVLVLSYESLSPEGGIVLDRLFGDLENFIPTIGDKDAGKVSKIIDAISIVVTKVSDPSQGFKKRELEIEELQETYNAVKDNAKAAKHIAELIAQKKLELEKEKSKPDTKNEVELRLKRFIADSPTLSMRPNMKRVLEQVVAKGAKGERYAYFSMPNEDGDKSTEEVVRIWEVIDNSTSFSKEDVEIGIKVSSENEAEVMRAIDGISEMGRKLADSINEEISEGLRKIFENTKFQQDELEDIKRKCETIKGYSSPRTLEAFFKDVCSQLDLSAETLKKYQEFNKFLTFMVSLLPEKDRAKYTDVKNWVIELGLNAILDKHIKTATALLAAPESEYVGGLLTVRGYHVKTSQVDEAIQGTKDKIERIAIQALHTITIDNDLTDGNPKCKDRLPGVNLSLIAPRIVVIGDKAIDLSGKAGASGGAKAAGGAAGAHGAAVGVATFGNGGGNGGAGADGVPGSSGTSSGNLFIACEEFSGQDRLSISLNGGNGGRGQDGGDGGAGGNGSGTTMDGWSRRGFVGDPPDGGLDEWVVLRGGAGGAGGNAGRGGKGGDAGSKGECHVAVAFALKPHSGALAIVDGTKLGDGAAGTAGLGGLGGRTWRGMWHRRGDSNHKDHNGHGWNGWHMPAPIEGGRAGSGAAAQGLNTSGWVGVSRVVPRQNVQVEFLNYKIFLGRELHKYSEVIGSSLNPFVAQYSNFGAGLAITRDFLDEANALEDYASKHRNALDFLLIYRSLLARVKAFSLMSGRAPHELKVLEYLYATTLGRISRINAAADNLLLIDIYEYVKNLVSGDFAALQKLDAQRIRDHYRAQYQEKVEDKITEVRKFLDILKDDVSSRLLEIEPKIAQLIKEVETAKKAGEAGKVALQEKRRALEEELKKKAILGAIGLVIQGIGMIFPPAGPIVASVVNAGINLATKPSIENGIDFATKAYQLKDQLGKLPQPKDAKPHEVNFFKQIQELAKTVAPLVEGAVGLLREQQAGDAKLAQLDAEIAQVQGLIKELEAYLNTVPKALGDYLKGSVHEVEDFQKALEDKSIAGLEFSKLEIKRFFENLKLSIKIIVGKFESAVTFEDLITKMQDAIDISINLCLRI